MRSVSLRNRRNETGQTYNPGASSKRTRLLLSISWTISSSHNAFISSAQLAMTSVARLASISLDVLKPPSWRSPLRRPTLRCDFHPLDRTKISCDLNFPFDGDPLGREAVSSKDDAPSRSSRSFCTLRRGVSLIWSTPCFSLNRNGGSRSSITGIGVSSSLSTDEGSIGPPISEFRRSRMTWTSTAGRA